MYTDFISSILQEASAIAKRNFGHASQITTKDGDANQVLTATDLEVGKLLVSAVRQAYPDHNIIDEEAGIIDNGSSSTWVIDPIDGTSNFANGLPHYGIMIGLIHDGHVIAGGVSLPQFDEIYLASKGEGAFCNDARIETTKSERLIDNLVAYNIDGNHAHPEVTYRELEAVGRILVNIRNVRNSGSVYDLGALATGKYGAWLTRTAKIWDLVAPHIIAEEAGALVTTYDGQPVDYSNPLAMADETFTWCIAPPALHSQLQDIIHRR